MTTSWEIFEPRYRALLEREFSADTFLSWLHAWSDLTKEVNEEQAELMLAHHKDVRDTAAEAAYFAFQRDVMSAAEICEQKLRTRLDVVDPAHHPEVALALRRLKTDAEIYSPDNARLNLEIEEKLSQFNKVRSALRLEFGSQKMSLHDAFPKQFDVEREVRDEAFIASERAKASVSAEVDALMLELVSLRQKLAENVNLKHFREYTWRKLYRYDYTPAESLDMHRAIAQEVVPLLARHYEKKQKELHIPSLRPWDVLVDPKARPPLEPFSTVEALEEGLERVFRRIDPSLGERFASMRDGLLDLENREGKLSMVGYCMPLPKSKRAYIYHSVFGSHADVWIMLHEAGHAFHNILAAEAQDVVWNHQPGPEFCELASQTMELLGLAYLERDEGGFYRADEASQAKEEQLLRCLRLIGTAQTDAFHHWLYPRAPQGVSIEEMDDKWLELERLYNPWLDLTGLEEYVKKGWQSPHVIIHPFYALDYKIAMFGALEIWRSSLRDQQQALDKYKHSLSLGGSRSLPELFERAGATFSFDEEHIRSVAKFLWQQLEAVDNSTPRS